MINTLKRPLRVNSVLRADFATKTSEATALFDGGRLKLKSSYSLEDLWSAVESYKQIPLTDEIKPETRKFLKRSQHRIGLLEEKRLFHPSFNLGTVSFIELLSSSPNAINDPFADAWDAAILRLRPFLHESDLPAEKIIEEVMGAKKIEPDNPIRLILSKHYNMKEAPSLSQLYFAKAGGSGLVVNYLYGQNKTIAGTARFHVEFSIGDAGRMHPKQEQSILEVTDKLSGPFFRERGIKICNISHPDVVNKWLKKYEYHDSSNDVGYFEHFMPVEMFSYLVRRNLVHHLQERFYSLIAINEMIGTLIPK